MKWNAINTAPTNKAILVYIPGQEHYGPPIYRAMLADMGSGRRWHSTAWACGRDLGPEVLPTAWADLPEPPEGALAGPPMPRPSFSHGRSRVAIAEAPRPRLRALTDQEKAARTATLVEARRREVVGRS